MNTLEKVPHSQIDILVVGDSLAESRRLLDDLGFGVVTVSDPERAIEAARQFHPMLVISDVIMPKLNGCDLCRTIKSDKDLQGTTVALVASMANPREVLAGLESGADQFIWQPLDEENFQSHIRYLLSHRDSGKTGALRLDVDIPLGGMKQLIHCELQQIVDLLLSTYREAERLHRDLAVRNDALSHATQFLNAMCRTADHLNRCKSEKETAAAALDLAMELPGVRAGWLALWDSQKGFRIAAACNLPPALESPGAMEVECKCRRMLLSGELTQAMNMLKCERLVPSKGATGGLRHHATIPLRIGERRLGVLNLAGVDQGVFIEKDLKILHGIGHQVTSALSRVRTIEHLDEQVAERTSELQHRATHDGLTGLPNRLLLFERVDQGIAAVRKSNGSAVLLLMNLNRFGDINDTLGHHRGDVLLRLFGQRLAKAFPSPAVVSRSGGDEFAVALPDPSGNRDVNAAVGKTLKACGEPFMIEGLSIIIRPSIGIAVYPEHGDQARVLMERADAAMAAAKQAGVDSALFDAKLDRHSPRRLAIMGQLQHAIESEHLLLCYQPKVDLRVGKVVGVEALARWRHPQYGMIPPDDFIQPADRSGLIRPLTRWVLATALRQCRLWHQNGMSIRMAVNLSRRDLMDPRILELVAESLNASRVRPESLEIEFSESTLMGDAAYAVDVLAGLRGLGIGVAVDDFGTGYSCINSLKKLPISELKLDRSLIASMNTEENGEAVVRSSIDLGHSLGFSVVAEGVEDSASWKRLSELGCDKAQGYYLCRPLAADELTRWFRESTSRRGQIRPS